MILPFFILWGVEQLCMTLFGDVSFSLTYSMSSSVGVNSRPTWPIHLTMPSSTKAARGRLLDVPLEFFLDPLMGLKTSAAPGERDASALAPTL
jgi:hypothetical protein